MVKWNHHTTGCSLNIMSTVNVNQQNSQAHISNRFHSGQIALIWKKNQFLLVWLKWSCSRTKEYLMHLNENNKYNVVKGKEKSFLLYQ